METARHAAWPLPRLARRPLYGDGLKYRNGLAGMRVRGTRLPLTRSSYLRVHLV
jgi:hypothetical protein